MEKDDANIQQVGGDAAGVRLLFLSRCAGSAALRIGDLGGHLPHGKKHVEVSGKCDDRDDGVTRAEEI